MSKSDFPIFTTHPDLVYLDSAATTQKPAAVLAAITNHYTTTNGPIHRGLYPLSISATEAYERARTTIADFFGCQNSSELIFTKSTTESLNLLAHSLTHNLRPRDEIILSVAEHHANIVPWQVVAKEKGLIIHYTQLSSEGGLDYTHLKTLLSDKTKIISLSHCSNVLGKFLNTQKVSAIIDESSTSPTLIYDISQSAAHIRLNLPELGCDFAVASGHKLYGPTGVGLLWGKLDQLELLIPYQTGGDMIQKVTLENSTWNALPNRLEAGTPPIEATIGLAAAVIYLQSKKDTNSAQLSSLLLDQLKSISQISVLGSPNPESGIISFIINGIHPHDLADLLGQRNICIRAGHHCAMPLHTHLKIPASNRVSIGIYTTEEDIHIFITALKEVIQEVQNA